MNGSRGWLFLSLFSVCGLAAACDGDSSDTPDAAPLIDSPTAGCDPATVLPANFRPIPKTSVGMVQVTTAAGVTSGTVDATAGGPANSADNPYLYLDLRSGMKVAVNDLDARSSMEWDIALKRASLRVNSGDSGTGGRKLAVVQAATLAEVTASPAAGYNVDDFADATCMELSALPIGDPMSAFGEWYNYDTMTHMVSPKSEVYVLERPDGSHTALRVITYYGDTASPMRGAFYRVEWKQL